MQTANLTEPPDLLAASHTLLPVVGSALPFVEHPSQIVAVQELATPRKSAQRLYRERVPEGLY
ncbi:hypothetical protein ZHAS_00020390 [Anopheles sinensis]|uniref:Uncharacterized protein n=1 Tax=Anopheles sinensis TaxID=74873 RepID=A0A084WPX8_ANOSI|nr:hypothetical protein ZHAS_00020390 [Anopheles sinensis]